MGSSDAVVTPPRGRYLGMKRWQVALWVILPWIALVAMTVAAFHTSGLEQLSTVVYAVIAAVLLALVAVVFWPRRVRDPKARVDGTVVVAGSRATAALSLTVWALLLVLCVVWAVMLAVGERFGSPVWMIIAIVGAAVSLGDLWRLVTGRLYMWRVELSPDGLRYRGYRRDETVPWSKLHAVIESVADPAGVVVDRKGQAEDFTIPALAFRHPAGQLVELIEGYRAHRTRMSRDVES